MSPCGQTIAPILMKFTRRFTVCCSAGEGVGDGGAVGVEFQSGYSSQILLCCWERSYDRDQMTKIYMATLSRLHDDNLYEASMIKIYVKSLKRLLHDIKLDDYHENLRHSTTI
ncbi:hypothetical protein CDAR_569191 [Caerostris darwini]|uniref:Uncharacterized protein n=1 Tax=Caerostris darwini TaxID=1538125 RepID=A0AAV4QB47_9ARAC|nr:hypothetical protein CDAR_569191 [Caerostris darwini]